MDELAELVLLTDVHGLRLRIVLILVEDAREPALHLTRRVQLQNAVV